MAMKGIVARGVLLDFRSWATRQGINYNPFETFSISVAQLESVAKEQNVEFMPADILIIRTGWTEHYRTLSPEAQASLGGKAQRTFVGVEQSEEMLRWHWDHAFAAVAGDTNAYEAWPPQPKDDRMKTSSCHEVFLSGWGMPIGEVWDLEELAKACEKNVRWSFTITSQPLNLPSGVASPANVMAIL
jgi:kynurenine formamidase